MYTNMRRLHVRASAFDTPQRDDLRIHLSYSRVAFSKAGLSDDKTHMPKSCLK
jgi:hypothetical protein